MATTKSARELTRAEKLDRIRTAITFAANTAPYALTDDEADELTDFTYELDNE